MARVLIRAVYEFIKNPKNKFYIFVTKYSFMFYDVITTKKQLMGAPAGALHHKI